MSIQAIRAGLGALPQFVTAMAATEMTLTGLRRLANKVDVNQVSREIGAAALYGVACFSPIPYVTPIAMSIFTIYSLRNGGNKDAYTSSKCIFKAYELTKNNILVPLTDKVIVPVMVKVARVVDFVWKHCGGALSAVVKKVATLVVDVFKAVKPLLKAVLEPLADLAVEVLKASWKISKAVARNVLAPLANLVWTVVRPVLTVVGSVLAKLSFIPSAVFKHPRFTAAVMLAGASIAYSRLR